MRVRLCMYMDYLMESPPTQDEMACFYLKVDGIDYDDLFEILKD